MELEENGCYAERLVRYFSGDRFEYYVFEVLRESLALLAGGAARGGSARGPAAARTSSDAGSTPIGGGGTFGGGGASGRF